MLVLVSAFGAAALSCHAARPSAPGAGSRVTLTSPAGARGAHVQIVRRLETAERVKLVQRFKERNGATWEIALAVATSRAAGPAGPEDGTSLDDVDAIRGLVRRARKTGARSRAEARLGTPAGKERATAGALSFATKNADLFGMSPRDVAALDLEVGPAKTATHGTWVAHLRGRIPMPAYEGFEAVASTIDLLVYVGDDGDPRYFVNLSRVHPRLLLDTTPVLGPDDKRVLRNVVGRQLFALLDDPTRSNARAGSLRRLPLGRVEDADVRRVRLVIYPSPGPRGAYVSYWLAYAVDVLRARQPFRFIVDADTGDILEDAVAPILRAELTGED